MYADVIHTDHKIFLRNMPTSVAQERNKCKPHSMHKMLDYDVIVFFILLYTSDIGT